MWYQSSESYIEFPKEPAGKGHHETHESLSSQPTEHSSQDFHHVLGRAECYPLWFPVLGNLFFLDSLKGRLISESWLTPAKDQN